MTVTATNIGILGCGFQIPYAETDLRSFDQFLFKEWKKKEKTGFGALLMEVRNKER